MDGAQRAAAAKARHSGLFLTHCPKITRIISGQNRLLKTDPCPPTEKNMNRDKHLARPAPSLPGRARPVRRPASAFSALAHPTPLPELLQARLGRPGDPENRLHASNPAHRHALPALLHATRFALFLAFKPPLRTPPGLAPFRLPARLCRRPRPGRLRPALFWVPCTVMTRRRRTPKP
jgi:hypothetical protein